MTTSTMSTHLFRDMKSLAYVHKNNGDEYIYEYNNGIMVHHTAEPVGLASSTADRTNIYWEQTIPIPFM